jgi:hypothetical protein
MLSLVSLVRKKEGGGKPSLWNVPIFQEPESATDCFNKMSSMLLEASSLNKHNISVTLSELRYTLIISTIAGSPGQQFSGGPENMAGSSGVQ